VLDMGGGLNAGGGATLSGVAYEGVLDLSRPFQQLNVVNGITLTDTSGSQAGTVLLTGAASRLVAGSSETLGNATIYLGSAGTLYLGQHIAAPELDAASGTTLTLGTATLLRSAGPAATLGNCSLGGWTDTRIVPRGAVLNFTARMYTYVTLTIQEGPSAVTLELPAGEYSGEWLNVETGEIARSESFRHAGGDRIFRTPEFSDGIALRLNRTRR